MPKFIPSTISFNSLNNLVAVGFKYPPSVIIFEKINFQFKPFKIFKFDKSFPLKIEFSFDGFSTILCLLSDYSVILLWTQSITREMSSLFDIFQRDELSNQVSDLTIQCLITPEFLQTEQDYKTVNISDLNITNCIFFPSLSILGLQNSILVSSKNGTILKFNCNNSIKENSDNSDNRSQQFYNQFRTIYLPVLSFDDAKFPPNQDPFEINNIGKNFSLANKRHHFREFMFSHKYFKQGRK